MEWIIGAVAIVAALLGWTQGRWNGRARGQREGQEQAKAEALDDAMDRLEAGRGAVRDGRGDDPADRLRNNDGQW
jgi:NaMN:DMB phosphoribosyltransferase